MTLALAALWLLITPAAAQESVLLQEGDLVMIHYIGERTLDMLRATVAAAGTITVPSIGEIRAVGLTVEQLDQLLRRGGKVVESVWRRHKAPPIFLEIFRPGQRPERMKWLPSVPLYLDPGVGCPTCG